MKLKHVLENVHHIDPSPLDPQLIARAVDHLNDQDRDPEEEGEDHANYVARDLDELIDGDTEPGHPFTEDELMSMLGHEQEILAAYHKALNQ